MEIDQWLFGKAAKAFKNWSESRKRRRESRLPFVRLVSPAGTSYFTKFVCLLRGWSPELKTTPGKIALTSQHLGLPLAEPLTTSQTANNAYILLAVICMATSPSETFFRRARQKLREHHGLREIFQIVRDEFHSIRHMNLQHYEHLYSMLQSAHSELATDADLAHNRLPETQSPQQIQKEAKQKAYDFKVELENPEMLTPDKEAIEQYTLGHSFEKIETAEEFDGVWRDLDDSDEMEEHREALSDLKLRHFIRSDDPSHTTLESDDPVGAGFIAGDAATAAEFWYDEWDYKKKAYRPEFCGVVAEVFQKQNPHFMQNASSVTRRERELLERRIVSLIQEKTIKRRLASGDDVDFDALIERCADLKARVTPGDNVYTRRSRLFADIALYILMDISLSTDSFLNGRRILDVEKQSIFAFGEVLSRHDIRFAIGAFYSRTRNHCRFLRIKDFADDFGKGCDRLGAIEPIGYTRIGPALRHAATLLNKEPARRRWIILLTDGRPNDYDHYEGKYGIEDVHQAISELRQGGTMLHTLAIGKDEKPAIPAMMRSASYRMLPDLSQLTDALGDFFRYAAR